MTEAKRTTAAKPRTTKAAPKPAAAETVVAETSAVMAETADKMTAAANEAATTMMEMFKMPTKSFADMFQVQPMEMPPVFRDMTEKSVAQVREAYDKVKTSAEEASDMVEDTFETTRKGMMDFNMKTLEVTKANTDATYDFFKKALGAKSIAETVELQTSFARECMDTFTAQAKDMQAFGQQFAEDVSKPAKDSIEKVMKDIKAA